MHKLFFCLLLASIVLSFGFNSGPCGSAPDCRKSNYGVVVEEAPLEEEEIVMHFETVANNFKFSAFDLKRVQTTPGVDIIPKNNVEESKGKCFSSCVSLSVTKNGQRIPFAKSCTRGYIAYRKDKKCVGVDEILQDQKLFTQAYAACSIINNCQYEDSFDNPALYEKIEITKNGDNVTYKGSGKQRDLKAKVVIPSKAAIKKLRM